MTPKAQATKEKIDVLGFTKIKILCTSKDTIKKVTRQLQIIHLTRDYFLEYTKNYYNSITKEKQTTNSKVGKELLEILFIYFWEGKRGRKRRETSLCGCLSSSPYWGPGQACALTGDRTGNPLFTGRFSIH